MSCPSAARERVITSEWVEGISWAEFLVDRRRRGAKQQAAEVLFRFAEGSIWRHGVFNGDPHPGNYRFLPDGTVTFLDFGLVKRWSPGELESLSPILDAVLRGDPDGTEQALVGAGFLSAGHGLHADAHLRLREHARTCRSRPTTSPTRPSTSPRRSRR